MLAWVHGYSRPQLLVLICKATQTVLHNINLCINTKFFCIIILHEIIHYRDTYNSVHMHDVTSDGNEFQSSTASGKKEYLKLFVFAVNPDNMWGFKLLRSKGLSLLEMGALGKSERPCTILYNKPRFICFLLAAWVERFRLLHNIE